MPNVVCGNCGATNRIQKFKIGFRPVCGRCGEKLPEPRWLAASRFFSKNWAWVVLVSAIGGGLWLGNQPPKPYRPPKPDCQAISVWPGVQKNFTGRSLVAPLKITTASGSDYFVKLVDSRTQQLALTIFVRGGRSLEVSVPLGSYRMKYASGSTWCGVGDLFGKRTRYAEADATFDFEDKGNEISGYTVRLIAQSNGNLRTKGISASSF